MRDIYSKKHFDLIQYLARFGGFETYDKVRDFVWEFPYQAFLLASAIKAENKKKKNSNDQTHDHQEKGRIL